MEAKIKGLDYNWHYTHKHGEIFYQAEVGKDGVTEIKEHRPAGEGDKWFYDIHFEDGSMYRVFNPSRVVFKKVTNDGL